MSRDKGLYLDEDMGSSIFQCLFCIFKMIKIMFVNKKIELGKEITSWEVAG